MKHLFVVLGMILFFSIQTQAQIRWSTTFGGGVSLMKDYFNTHLLHNYQGDYLFEGGLYLNSNFIKDGILGWQTGLLIRHSGFKRTPVNVDAIMPDPDGNISIGTGDDIPWAWEYTTKVRNWSLKVPVSFLFNVFDPVGIMFGGHLNYVFIIKEIGPFKLLDYEYQKLIPGIHLGLYAPIGDRLRINSQVSSDITPRLSDTGKLIDETSYRELAFSLNFTYQLSQ